MKNENKAGMPPLAWRGPVILTLALLVVMPAVTTDIGIPLLPQVTSALGSTSASAPLIISAYLFGYALFQVPVGLLGDRYGRLPVLFAGLVVFAAGGVATAFAQNMTILLGARMLQGMGSAVLAVLARAVIRDISEGERLSQLLSVIVAALAVATILAPLAGSLALLFWSWREAFLFTAAMGVVLFFMVRLYIPETLPSGSGGKSLTGQLKDSFRAFFTSPQCLWGVSLVAFPFFGYMGVIAGLSTVVVDVYSLPAYTSGPMFSATVLAYLASAFASRKLVGRLGPLCLIASSMWFFGCASLLLAWITVSGYATLPVLLFANCLYFAGFGIVFPNATNVVMAPLPEAAGFAASIIGSIQVFAASLGAFLVATLYQGTITAMTGVLLLGGLLTLSSYHIGRRRLGEIRL